MFIRSNQSVSLTKEGEKLLPYAKEIVSKSENFLKLATSQRDSNPFCIGYSGYWEFNYLCELVRYVAAVAPAFNVSFIREHHGRLFYNLRKGHCDLIFALRENTQMSLWNGIKWKSIATSPFYIVVSSHHPLAKCKSLHLDDLSNETIILLDQDQDSLLNAFISQTLQKKTPFPDYFPFPPKNTYDLVLLVLANKGIAFTSKWLELSKVNGLSFIELADPVPSAEFGVAYREGKASSTLEYFLDAIDKHPFCSSI